MLRQRPCPLCGNEMRNEYFPGEGVFYVFIERLQAGGISGAADVKCRIPTGKTRA